MPINWILFIVYLITSFFAAKKFLHHRFFYYLYVLAALDPVFVIIKKFFPISIHNITYQSIVTLFILFAYPSDKLRSKLFLGTIIVLSMLHFDIEVIVTVISNVLAFVFVSIELFELMLIEVKENGKGYVSAYHLLLLLEAVLTGTGMLLYQEAVNIYVRLYPLILSINITILFLLSIWGPIKKINITFLNKGRILLKTENGFFRYIRFNRPTNISNSKIEIPSAVNTINPDIFAVTNQLSLKKAVIQPNNEQLLV